jgi:hypothetical protein
MKRSYAWVLLVAAAWSLWVWSVFIFNQVRSPDPSETTGFKVVHFTLAAISIVLALAVGSIGIRSLRDHRSRNDASPADERDLTTARS